MVVASLRLIRGRRERRGGKESEKRVEAGTSCLHAWGESMLRTAPLLLAGVLCLDVAHRGSVDAFISSPALLRRPLARERSIAASALQVSRAMQLAAAPDGPQLAAYPPAARAPTCRLGPG